MTIFFFYIFCVLLLVLISCTSAEELVATAEHDFSDTDCKSNALLSPCRLQLIWGFIVTQQPAGHPSERPAKADTHPSGFCIWITDTVGLSSASIFILMFRTSQQAGRLSAMQFRLTVQAQVGLTVLPGTAAVMCSS